MSKELNINRKFRLSRRNQIMSARYYYWTEYERRRFDDVLHILSTDEFFMDERTICSIISNNSDYINTLIANTDSIVELRRLYPSWKWR